MTSLGHGFLVSMHQTLARRFISTSSVQHTQEDLLEDLLEWARVLLHPH